VGRALAEGALACGAALRARVRDDSAPGRAFLNALGFAETGAQLSMHWSGGAPYQPPMPALRVRPASEKDEAALEKLSQAAWTGAPDTRPDEIAQLFTDDDRVVLIAESDGKPLAYLSGVQLGRTVAAIDAVGMDVSFRTDEDSIKVEDMGPLLKLGALAAAVPDAKLRVAGFADPRGAAGYNEALSQRRAEAVAAALICGGVTRERLIIEAHGASESASEAGDLDGYALDRRVTVRLERPPAAAAFSFAGSANGSAAPGRPAARSGGRTSGCNRKRQKRRRATSTRFRPRKARPQWRRQGARLEW